MKQCPHCKIEVVGNTVVCPLCQNDLRGHGEANIWPFAFRLKAQSMIYKIQLFVMLAIAALCFTLNFVFDIHPESNWSVPIVLWIVVLQFVILDQVKHFTHPAKLVNLTMLYVAILVLITAWFYHIVYWCLYLVLPIMYMVVAVTDFVLMILDKKGNALAYALAADVFGVAFYCILRYGFHIKTIMWGVCLLLAIISILGAFVFREKHVVSEMKKRLSI